MTAKASQPMPKGASRPPAPAAPPKVSQKPRPPEPPPMRIGPVGDTIDRAGVRRKADGSLRDFTIDKIRAVAILTFCLLMLVALVRFASGE